MTFNVITETVGWVYVVACSLSLYPQIFLTASRRSSAGLSLDGVILRLVGTAAYFVHIFVSRYHYQMFDQFPITEVVFVCHALFVAALLTAVAVWYRHDVESISRFGAFCLIGIFCPTFCISLASLARGDVWLLVQTLGAVKLFSTARYFCQIHTNWKNKSTNGFSAISNGLDILGSAASILHVGLINIDAPEEILTNFVKFWLGVICLLTKMVLAGQHIAYTYCARHVSTTLTA